MASSSYYHPVPFLLLLLLMLNASRAATAQNKTNITLGSSLSPLTNTYWLSPSGDFAFGFHPLDFNATLFLLAIWFDRTANKTVVWSANGDKPVLAGSSVNLTAAGKLSLVDDSGNEVWTAGDTNASHASLLDTGNLVLASTGGFPLWQSFDNPSDTILPSQTLSLGTQLRSRLRDTDYSDGRFVLRVQTDGNLVFYPLSIPTGYQYSPYWASGTVGNGSSLVFNGSGSIYLTLKDRTTYNLTSAGSNSYKGFYQRGTLDPDGVFRHYIYPKNGSSSGGGGSNPGWSAMELIPPDICQAITNHEGSGACGFNSYCKSGGGDNLSTDCECPANYSFLDPNRKYRGCSPNFAAQSCVEDESSLFYFVTMYGVDWPYADYEVYNDINDVSCQSECLEDCFCAVAIYNNGQCWKKKLPLSNGKMGNYVQRVAFIKVRRDNSTHPPPPFTAEIKKVSSVPKGWIAAGSSLLGTSVLINFLLFAAAIVLLTRKKRKLKPDATGLGLSLRRFTCKELEEATNDFSEELGSGAFGTVYKGSLQADPIISVAIKRLDKLLPDTEKEFDNEIRSIGQTHHKNLVRLLGFCNEGTERILVYENMRNGDLTSFLFGSGEKPAWNQRAQIATGIARGLLYLHEECSKQIIHCDIKPHNVLLDENFTARISDFGLAKLLRPDQTRTVTGIRGTRGYVAPEWFKAAAGGVTAKVDVYSFGVMLLEIVSCRRNVETGAGEEEEILTFWAYDCYRDGRVGVLVDWDREAAADIQRVERFVAVAIWCIQDEPAMRPSMKVVTQMLDGTVAIPVAPDPSFSWSSSVRS